MSDYVFVSSGLRGNTVKDLREVATMWDSSARVCDLMEEPGLAQRDRRFATAMRKAADILEAQERA